MFTLGLIGAQEIIVILLIVLILFGGKKIPELMRGLGKGVREYKNAVNDVEDSLRSEASEVKQDGKKRTNSHGKYL